MLKKYSTIIFLLLIISFVKMHSQSLNTYMNPVIPGDHPDPTLTKIGNDFYTSGSSFNPTPKIYHSTDLVHWEVIAQPVSASWSEYGNTPGGGIWGGHMVLYNNIYWHFFGKGGGSIYFVTAEKPEGPWSNPTKVNVPSGVPGLGVDNSIFIDDNNKWYMLTKAGPQNNHIVELGDDGQPTGDVLYLTWLNPDSEGNPYGWAEGPVMWKYNGYYYYSFAQHLVGSQYVMRSDSLTDEKSSWTIIGSNIFTGTTNEYNTPNHISPAVLLDDGTSWVIAHSYNSNWYAQGRQGLLCKVTYDVQGFPKIQRPSSDAVTAPALPSSGIPWTVPHSDYFDSHELNPEWSFLGYTPNNTYSLSERPGWLKLSEVGRSGRNAIIKNDGEHNYTLLTKVEFDPTSIVDEAGLWIINGPQTHEAKVYSSVNNANEKILVFSFEETKYEVENSIGSALWFKLIRNEHIMSGFYSADGFTWNQIGESINASAIDIEQTQFNNFTGNQQGLYTIGKTAYFDLYIYRDAYSPIMATNPANQYGTKVLINRSLPNSLTFLNDNDWVLYAGVEFGNSDYPKQADSISVFASCNSSGGVIDVLLDSLSGVKIAELQINNTGGWDKYEIFTSNIIEEFSGCHDVYLKFKGAGTEELFRLQTLTFIEIDNTPVSVGDINKNQILNKFILEQNYPNPFNPETIISFSIPDFGEQYAAHLQVFDILGNEVSTLINNRNLPAGRYEIPFDASALSSGVYFYQLLIGNLIQSKKMLVLR